jgi:DHA1 family bicyclomycin/chloramphenicol resistance-like MFS transporter
MSTGQRQSSPVTVPALALILAALAMIGPFTIDTYLPSFPFIGADLQATPAEMQQTLSLYLFTLALMTLFHGTLSDSFGRRPVILASLALYVVTAVGCALAFTLPQLLFWRAIQGLAAGAGIIVGRAIIRDTFSGHEAQRLMSLVTMIFGVAPAIAPVIGGWLQDWFGWRTIFWFLATYGVVLFFAVTRGLPETHPLAARQSFEMRPLLRNYLRLGSDPKLVLLCLAIAFNFSGFFLYVVSAPAVIYDLLHMTEKDFAWLFVPGISGVMFGAFLSGRLAERLSPRRTVSVGYLIMACAVVFNITYSLIFPPALPWTVLPVMVYTVGMALVMPSVTLIALDLFPKLRGMTSSLQGFAHSLFSALTAGVVSPLLSHSALMLACGMGGMALLGGLAWMLYLRVAGSTR